MNNFFNIALFPEDENLVSTCIQLAQTNLKDQSSEYLLGENAWPHVTLCEFISEQGQLAKIWSSIESMQTEPLLLNFEYIYILPGHGIHSGKTWVGLAVAKPAELVKLQKSIYEKLLQLGIEGATKIETYFPHLTWARCDGNKPITISAMPPQELWQKQHAFNLSIGLSDMNGAYHERLFSINQPDLAKRSVT